MHLCTAPLLIYRCWLEQISLILSETVCHKVSDDFIVLHNDCEPESHITLVSRLALACQLYLIS